MSLEIFIQLIYHQCINNFIFQGAKFMISNNLIKKEIDAGSSRFIEDIMNGMYDWVRVMDMDDNILYANKAMCEGIGFNPKGKKCFSILGRNEKCINCISHQTFLAGKPYQKEEIIAGKHFSIMSSPLRDHEGNIFAVVEVLRDITESIEMQNKLVNQNRILQNDLKVARKLQASLLPKNLPDDRMEAAYFYKPCENLGGDFIDIYSIDDDHTGVYIADVSGHGVSASMLTVFLRSSISKNILSPSQALTELYTKFNNYGFNPSLYITIFYAIIDHKSNIMTYTNAGHNASPLLFNKDKTEILMAAGIPISNWLENPEYKDFTQSLTKGDRIFFCTDGIIELKNKQNEQYGEERLFKILLTESKETKETLETIAENAREFLGQDLSGIEDDITMALIEIT